MKRSALIIFLIFLLVSPLYGWQSKAVKKANDFISAGMADEAVHALETGIQEKPKDHEAHWMLGKLYLERGSYSSAETRFNSAVLLNSSYGSGLGNLYKNAGSKVLSIGKIKQAFLLFNKAINYDPKLKNSIIKLKTNYLNTLFLLANNQLVNKDIKGAKQTHNRILNFFPEEKTAIFQSIIKVGNELNDTDCFNVYLYASTLCDNRCPQGRDVGVRLEKIALKLEKEDLIDPNVGRYLFLASKYKDDVKKYVVTYNLGEHPFKLSGGQITDHWIRFPRGFRTHNEYFSSNPKFEIVYKSGKIVKAWENKFLQGEDNGDFKIRAIEDTFVVLKITNVSE